MFQKNADNARRSLVVLLYRLIGKYPKLTSSTKWLIDILTPKQDKVMMNDAVSAVKATINTAKETVQRMVDANPKLAPWFTEENVTATIGGWLLMADSVNLAIMAMGETNFPIFIEKYIHNNETFVNVMVLFARLPFLWEERGYYNVLTGEFREGLDEQDNEAFNQVFANLMTTEIHKTDKTVPYDELRGGIKALLN